MTTSTLPVAPLLAVVVPLSFPAGDQTAHRCIREFAALDSKGRRAPTPKGAPDYRAPKPQQGYVYAPACQPNHPDHFYELTSATARQRGAVPCTEPACFPEVNL